MINRILSFKLNKAQIFNKYIKELFLKNYVKDLLFSKINLEILVCHISNNKQLYKIKMSIKFRNCKTKCFKPIIKIKFNHIHLIHTKVLLKKTISPN